MEEKLEKLSLPELRELAKEKGIKHISSLRKAQLIERIEAETSVTQEVAAQTAAPAPAAEEKLAEEVRTETRTQEQTQTRTQENYRSRESRDNRAGAPRDMREQRSYRRDSNQRENGQREYTPRSYGSRDNGQRDNGYRDNSYRDNSQRENGQREYTPRDNSQREYTPRDNAARENTQEKMPMELSALDSGNQASGVLEIMPDGYGFLRSDNYMPGENDVYVAPSQIRKFGLRTGDIISGSTRVRAQQEKFSALLFVSSVNGMAPSHSPQRRLFENMTPIFPDHRIRMERGSGDVAARIVDLIAPVGRGQRGMIVSPPKAGKTTLLKEIARSIQANDPSMHIIIMLIDERPEEVTDIREAITGDRVEVLDSTFDEEPSHHIRVAQMGIERAKRLVEYGENVTILLDSITRLARASNLTIQPSGRTLSGGLDPAALYMPKRFFGAARNMREGGSLTILATALVDTGSKMDDMVFEEFKGTGNMELVLDRKLSERRVFPAIDIQRSSTRREDLLLSKEEQEAVYIMRKALNGMKSDEATENILNMFVHTKDNEELVNRVRRQRFV